MRRTARPFLRNYLVEARLVSDFARCLLKGKSPWGHVQITFEFDYSGGYTDVVALGQAGELVAFEAKLVKWREALHQAYRTRCFAHRSFVVLPSTAAQRAVQHEYEFRRRRVGLCAVSPERGIEVLLDADPLDPFQPWLATRALDELAALKAGKKPCQPIQRPSKQHRRSVRQEA